MSVNLVFDVDLPPHLSLHLFVSSELLVSISVNLSSNHIDVVFSLFKLVQKV